MGKNNRMRNITVGLIIAFCLGLAALGLSVPGAIACATIDYSGLEVLPNGVRVEKSSSPLERAAIDGVLKDARLRIEKTFGTPRATPVRVVLKDTYAFFPFHFNSHGSTQFIGNRACIVIGPNGTNVDIMAHELTHAEIFDRAGPWARFWKIPTWFDEGVAMQVDHRPRYDMELPTGSSTFADITALSTARTFNAGNDEDVTRHYAMSKAIITRWLARTGHQNLYQKLEEIRQGQSVDDVILN
jgi:hypothetical protein